MEYLSVRETAEKWNLSVRMVQQFCAQGRIPGARKLGKCWAIPGDAEKPQDPRVARKQRGEIPPSRGLLDHTNLMPLMNTLFPPGRCLAAIEAMKAGTQRDIAMAEYHYFSGRAEEAARETEPYLHSADLGARLSACLIYAYANLTLGRIPYSRFALGELNTALGEQSPQFQAAAAFVARTSCPCCLWGCVLLPCMCRLTISTSRGTTVPVPALWRVCCPWARRVILSRPSIYIW